MGGGQGVVSHPTNLFWTDLLNVFTAPGDTIRTKESIRRGKVPKDRDEIWNCKVEQGKPPPCYHPGAIFPVSPGCIPSRVYLLYSTCPSRDPLQPGRTPCWSRRIFPEGLQRMESPCWSRRVCGSGGKEWQKGAVMD